MKTIDQLLDDAKEITGSDYKTAQQLGIPRTRISMIRARGVMRDDMCVKLAMLLNVSPAELFAACSIKRYPEFKEYWERWEVVPGGGIEPPTRGFSIPCSTD